MDRVLTTLSITLLTAAMIAGLTAVGWTASPGARLTVENNTDVCLGVKAAQWPGGERRPAVLPNIGYIPPVTTRTFVDALPPGRNVVEIRPYTGKIGYADSLRLIPNTNVYVWTKLVNPERTIDDLRKKEYRLVLYDRDFGVRAMVGCVEAALGAFMIDSVEYANPVTINAKPEDLKVAWSGDAAFPVDVVFVGPGDKQPKFCVFTDKFKVPCPDGTVRIEQKSNPLVVKGTIRCYGTFPQGTYRFPFEIFLRDRAKRETAKKSIAFDCHVP